MSILGAIGVPINTAYKRDEMAFILNDAEAKALVMDLVRKIPNLRPVDGGGLANAKYVEQITPLLVNINRIHKIHAGIKIVGLE